MAPIILENLCTPGDSDSNDHNIRTSSLSNFLQLPGTSYLLGANKTDVQQFFFSEEN